MYFKMLRDATRQYRFKTLRDNETLIMRYHKIVSYYETFCCIERHSEVLRDTATN